MQPLNDLFTFLANSPGNLVYILAVTFTIIASLQGAISQWRILGYPQMRRLASGLVLLLLFQLILFMVSGLAEQNVIPGSILLPVFDRAALLLGLIWMIWVWAFPEDSRNGDAATILLSLLVLAAAVFGSVAYSTSDVQSGSFNSAPQVFYWDLGALLILLMGFGLLILRKPENWGTGLAMFFLAFLGFSLDLFFTADKGDYSGIIRFFMLSAYPLLLSLPNRFSVAGHSTRVRTIVANPEPATNPKELKYEEYNLNDVRERRRYSTDPKTLQSLFALAAEIDVDKVNKDIVRSIAQALLVDLCFLIYIGDDRTSLYIATGYDLIREENLDGGTINRELVPMLATAILRGRPLRLPASTTSTDLKGLSDLLGLPNPGNLLNVPISSEKEPIGSILLLSPYSNRAWTADDQTFLTTIAASVVPILERIQRTSILAQSGDRVQSESKDNTEQLQRLQAANAELTSQINQLEQAAAEAAHQNESFAQSNSGQISESTSRQVENVVAAVPASANKQLESELRTTLAEMARLQIQLADSNTKILELESKTPEKIPVDQAEVIASISQELRQPMSSIIGYADLLLGESVGILGALQRKFIERIRTSTERIGSLVDDLIQITTLESGLLSVKPKSVDLNIIIDNAMAYTASQMREKNITLRIDIPENLQPLFADREALQQILIHLLQNAGSVTPAEGSVTLRVHMQLENGVDCVLLQVTDTGGGIPQEDLPRVFSRLYRAENALIQGVGDTGVGLSIAKSLTEAHHGRIWVETQPGSGSTFNVSLPLESSTQAEMQQGV